MAANRPLTTSNKNYPEFGLCRTDGINHRNHWPGGENGRPTRQRFTAGFETALYPYTDLLSPEFMKAGEFNRFR
jgi:hypothetical protein